MIWRIDRAGISHLCHKGYTNTLCGSKAKAKVTTGVPCPECLALATDALAG